jgi:hypothetical protein
MNPSGVLVLTAARLPELCRAICAHAGIPVLYGQTTADRFVVRSHDEDPELLTKLLEDAFAEDEAEFRVFRREEHIPFLELRPGEIVVKAGPEASCPEGPRLREAARGGRAGEALFFAVERRDAGGRVLGVTWAALAGEAGEPEQLLQAAVLRKNY